MRHTGFRANRAAAGSQIRDFLGKCDAALAGLAT
jgi:hypothetical protein